MKRCSSLFQLAALLILITGCQPEQPQQEIVTAAAPTTKRYDDLVALFKEWRSFETPPLKDGAPNYTASTFEKRWTEFEQLQGRLMAVDTTEWPVEEKVDWMVVWAEMNGYDFNHHILKPWERDPAFYKVLWMDRSDVPAHEGPTNHAALDVWKYSFPLNTEDKIQFLEELSVIPAFNEQAKINLTGNAKDLWVAGIRDIRTQSEDLKGLLMLPGVKEDAGLVQVINDGITSTEELVEWLEEKAETKTGPSGVGKENYTWYLQNVHLVPLTWDDEVMLLKRELSRAWASLKLEEHRNRNLPELTAADSPEAFKEMAEKAAVSMMTFLEQDEIVTVKPYFEPALREHLGSYVPKERRNFFLIGMHYDPRPLYSHFYHWFELARMDNEPHESEIRKGPLLYNIFDSRNEGTATAVEEMFMQAGFYDDDPRVREIVYIMIAQRAARGLGSLYAQANEMNSVEAGSIHSEYTPRGWMKTEKELLLFEQHLYLRQPGYGSSYITGKYLLENAMAEFARMKEANNEPFKVKDFFDQLNAIGCIPISLGHWQMTGNDDHLKVIRE
ncbi:MULTISPECIES: hypothetical protein [unclassified Imperialibacter]|uniref:hypothetical protein n=1 Tax=unclassified Imperialibacter TaxID=2629706 RepID=UPI00125AEC88|nr:MULTISPECIES: hypothetical protein [unclassified Imperialibacter]CAD5251352.1 conserved hypothetical protein [Imperialibacter sp. 89]CAD5284470.1 conserved hypothetical protein [Imperialibacter sp. 75]VVT11198.1 conserved hypothetical protein [Imperialibacter sp. EC-SDR9]